MKILLKASMLAGALALSACGGNGDDQAAENVEDAYDNKADAFDAQAANATNEVVEDRLQEKAEQLRDTGAEKAEAIDDTDGATVDSNVDGM